MTGTKMKLFTGAKIHIRAFRALPFLSPQALEEARQQVSFRQVLPSWLYAKQEEEGNHAG